MSKLKIDRKFDAERCRHLLNDKVTVLHCHHYATLYSQLADDVSMLDGKKLLSECAEDTFVGVLKEYFAKHSVTDVADRIAIVEEYYATAGLGKLAVTAAGAEAGEIELIHSHVDEGWVKKWGKRDKPVNFITWGYAAAAFSAVFDAPTRTYAVTETASIVSGAERSKLKVVKA